MFRKRKDNNDRLYLRAKTKRVMEVKQMSLAECQTGEAAGHARALLDPAVMRLPDALEQALQEGVTAWEAGLETSARKCFERAMELAKEFGYL